MAVEDGVDRKTPLASEDGVATLKPKAKSDRLTMVVDVGVDDAPLASEDRVVKPAKTQRPVANEEEFFKAPPGTQPDPFPAVKGSSDSDVPYGPPVETSRPGIKEKTAPSNAEGFIENTDSGRLPSAGEKPTEEPLTEFEKLPERPE
ncbi:hypothetical protein AAVH_03925 [Aphelenchoides avenae]|nr:hypothetical protein AAVH_03925 [Aphelenchus avenae]